MYGLRVNYNKCSPVYGYIYNYFKTKHNIFKNYFLLPSVPATQGWVARGAALREPGARSELYQKMREFIGTGNIMLTPSRAQALIKSIVILL